MAEKLDSGPPPFSGKVEEWEVWSFKFEAFCTARDYDSVLDGSEKCMLKQKKVYSWLALAVQSQVCINKVKNVSKVNDQCGTNAWNALVQYFAGGHAVRKTSLMSELHNRTQQPHESAAEFVAELESIVAKLEAVNITVPEEQVSNRIIVGLQPKYAPVIHTILAGNDTSMTTIKRIVETNCKYIESAEAHNETKVGIAYLGERSQQNYKNRVPHYPQPRNVMHAGNSNASLHHQNPHYVGQQGPCWYCSGPHLKRQCPKWRAEIDSRKGKHVNNQDPSASMAAASDMPPVVFNAAINDTNEMKDSQISFTDLWLLDGGCTDHMISDKTDFSTYTKFTRPLPIGGIKCEAIGIGSVCMHIQTCDNESIPAVVENVLHVPDLPTRSQEGFRRLFSQSTACKGGSEFSFSSKGNYIYLGNGYKIPVLSIRKNTLYGLQTCIKKGSVLQVAAYPAVSRVSKRLWHQRLGHLHEGGIDSLAKCNHLQCVESEPLPFCKVCAEMKSIVHPRNRHLSELPATALEIVGCDILALPRTTIGGHRYALGIIDYKTSAVWVALMKGKDEVCVGLVQIIDSIKRLGQGVPCRLRTDNEPVFTSTAVMDTCRNHGIHVEYSAPDSQWQNGRIERMWRTLQEMAGCMLKHAGLDMSFYGFALAAAVYTRNRVWSSSCQGIPLELLTSQPVNLNHIKVFGCPAFVHIDSSRRSKFEPRAFEGVFVGYALDSPAYLIWNSATKRVIRSRNVEFDELWESCGSSGSESVTTQQSFMNGNLFMDISEEIAVDDATVNEAAIDSELETARCINTPPKNCNNRDAESQNVQEHQCSSLDGMSDESRRYPQRERRPPGEWWVAKRREPEAFHAMPLDPISYDEAMNSEDSLQWQEAIEQEYSSLMQQNVWELCPLPSERKPVGCKWEKSADSKPGWPQKVTVRKKILITMRCFHQLYTSTACDLSLPLQYITDGKFSKWMSTRHS